MPYFGCMVMVCAVCESCETALQRILRTLLRFHWLYTKYQMILKLIPSERRESVLSYCLIFFPKLHKIDLEITVSKRAVFKTRLSRNLFSRPSACRGGFVKMLTYGQFSDSYPMPITLMKPIKHIIIHMRHFSGKIKTHILLALLSLV